MERDLSHLDNNFFSTNDFRTIKSIIPRIIITNPSITLTEKVAHFVSLKSVFLHKLRKEMGEYDTLAKIASQKEQSNNPYLCMQQFCCFMLLEKSMEMKHCNSDCNSH